MCGKYKIYNSYKFYNKESFNKKRITIIELSNFQQLFNLFTLMQCIKFEKMYDNFHMYTVMKYIKILKV